MLLLGSNFGDPFGGRFGGWDSPDWIIFNKGQVGDQKIPSPKSQRALKGQWRPCQGTLIPISKVLFFALCSFTSQALHGVSWETTWKCGEAVFTCCIGYKTWLKATKYILQRNRVGTYDSLRTMIGFPNCFSRCQLNPFWWNHQDKFLLPGRSQFGDQFRGNTQCGRPLLIMNNVM